MGRPMRVSPTFEELVESTRREVERLTGKRLNDPEVTELLANSRPRVKNNWERVKKKERSFFELG